jgi:glutamine synthetase
MSASDALHPAGPLAGATTVHLGLVDASGTLREKRLSAAAAERALRSGWSFIDAIDWWGPDDTVWRSGGSRSNRALVDVESARPYPFGDDAAFFLADFAPPLRDLSPRARTQDLVKRAAACGVEALLAWEFECLVLEPGTGAPTPTMADNRCWSALTMACEDEILAGLVETLSAGGVPVDHLCAELGPGCLELATAPESALRSADSALLAKLYTKAYFARQGRRATFMAQLGPQFPGLGGHPSLSLRSLVDGAPVLCDEPGVLSKVGAAAVAGVIALLPELLALAAPNPNSYRRFGPGNWAPATATWGLDNYSCALRVVADDPASARLELRIPGADVSPHHCAALFLGSALWGIEERLDPPPPVQAPDDGRTHAGAAPLPRDLVEAAERFEASAAARDLFGSVFVEHYAAARLVEAAACHRFVSDEERARYLAQV